MRQAARMLESHLESLMTCLKRGISNAVIKGLNAKLQLNKYRALEAFKMAIYFELNALDFDASCPEDHPLQTRKLQSFLSQRLT
jgi:hypothetical protein